MCFYNRESLPGYSAIFRHANDELNYCYYLIPCGKDGMCGDVTVRAQRAVRAEVSGFRSLLLHVVDACLIPWC